MHAAVTEDIRKRAGNDDAIFQRVAGAGWRLDAIAHRPQLAVGAAADIHGIDVQPAISGNLHAVEWAKESGMCIDQFRRKETFVEETLWPIDVGNDEIEEFGTLGEGGLDARPLVGAEKNGDSIEIPRAVHAGRIAVDVVGDAIVVDQLLGGFPAAAKFGGAEVVEQIDEHIPVRPHGTIAFFHFVEDGGWGYVAGA